MARHEKRVPKLYISFRLVKPFLTLLADYDGYPKALFHELQKLDLDSRVPIEWAHRQLEIAVQRSGDPNIGLKAGRIFDLGDRGAFDYAIQSAATVLDAIEVASWGTRLLSDACDFRLEIDGELAIARLDSRVVLPKISADFHASYTSTTQRRLTGDTIPGLEWWFPYDRPRDTTEYEKTFSPAKLRFSAPCLGYAFNREYLGMQMKYADPKLHTVIRKHIDLLLAELPRTNHLMDNVKDIIINELGNGRPTAASVARRLHMSSRTLARKLHEEGTTFSLLLDEVRRKLALQHIVNGGLTLSETSSLVGFADIATFYHAFKRWTGQTPLQYRQLQTN